MSVLIKEVQTKKDLKNWVDFPTKLYKNVPAYVPFLRADELNTFNQKENMAYEFCETRLFLAYKDGKIVGRIGGLINHAANQKWGTNNIRFTRFDFIDDYDVSKALFDKVVEWGKERGYNKVIGPIGFTDMDHEGMLIDGFDELNMSITFYNHPYYIDHMEKLGAEKEVDWVEYLISVPTEYSERHAKISKFLQEKHGYKLVKYKKVKDLEKDAFEAFKVIDEAFSRLYGTVPLTDKVITKTIKDNIPLMNLKYICSIKDKNDDLIAFAVLVPSIAKALKKSNGKLFPFGIVRMLKALKGKNDTLEMFLVAVEPTLQTKGISALIINTLLKVLIENDIKYCETGPMLETNTAIHSLWKHFEKEQHKRRRCYIKNINE